MRFLFQSLTAKHVAPFSVRSAMMPPA